MNHAVLGQASQLHLIAVARQADKLCQDYGEPYAMFEEQLVELLDDSRSVADAAVVVSDKRMAEFIDYMRDTLDGEGYMLVLEMDGTYTIEREG